MEDSEHELGDAVTYIDFYGKACIGTICNIDRRFSTLTSRFHTTYKLGGVHDRIFTRSDLRPVKCKLEKDNRINGYTRGKRIVRVKSKSQRLKELGI